jgi:endosialidase-like protein
MSLHRPAAFALSAGLFAVSLVVSAPPVHVKSRRRSGPRQAVRRTLRHLWSKRGAPSSRSVHTTAAAIIVATVVFGAPVRGQSDVMPSPAQAERAQASQGVPGFIPFNGTLLDAQGSPVTGTVTVTFSLYSQNDQDVPLWSETQFVAADQRGRYSVLLGSTQDGGVPVAAFASGDARWVGIHAEGKGEQPRVALLSVPYALKAADAATLGGRPASDYVLAGSRADGLAAAGPTAPATSTDKSLKGLGAANFIAKFTDVDVLGNSQIFDDGVNVGVGTSSPSAKLHVAGPVLASSVSASAGSFNATSAANVLVATQGGAGNAIAGTSLGGAGVAGSGPLGVLGTTADINGVAVRGDAVAPSGVTIGVLGQNTTPGGTGVEGRATAATGTAVGVRGSSLSDNGIGLRGEAPSATGDTRGVVGYAASATGQGVQGNAPVGIGVYGFTSSGTGLRGHAGDGTASTVGVYGTVISSAGVPGLFDNLGGGDILRGRAAGSEKFKVDGAGVVYATEYRNLSGTPIPNGDITGVGVGTGLAGGGSAGDVSVALDTAFTDGRYAAAAHGHVAGDVAGVATLGANAFVGNQTITGNATVTGHVNLGSVRAVSSTTCCPVEGQANTTSPAFGVVGRTASTNGGAAGVYGVATAPTGAGSVHGVYGETLGSVGGAVRGLARHQFGTGVEAFTEGTSATALLAQALAASGSTTGLLAVVSSPSGTAARLQSAGGDLLVGQNAGVRFRVDGTGAVFATAYRDVAGNPIPGGDITGVGASTGLTGGGSSGDVSVALDTAFTDARYASLVHGHPVSAISGAATLAANTFSGTQVIDGGNLDLDASSATAGNITKNGTRFLHNYGTENTFLGAGTGNQTMTGLGRNTAVGYEAFASNNTGQQNTVVGSSALTNNTSGIANVAVGESVLRFNTIGGGNVAIGTVALQFNTSGNHNTSGGHGTLRGNTTGSFNTAFGMNALEANTTGQSNTALGRSALGISNGNNNVALGNGAGANATAGSFNIYLGAEVFGVAGETHTMYLGKQGTQTKTVIAGIRGTTVTGGEMVVIDSDGRLGTAAMATGADTVGSVQVIDESLVASDLAPNSVTSSELAAGSVTADKVAFNYAGSATPGGPAADVACVACVGAAEVAFSFASLGANTFSGTQVIDNGNLDLDVSTATAGNITKNGSRFLHNSGPQNTFLGHNAGTLSVTGAQNTAMGEQALTSLTSGAANTANGQAALFSNTSGSGNTATGGGALSSNSTGSQNTAMGRDALLFSTTGNSNTALGHQAMLSNTTGFNNTASGIGALSANITGFGNTSIGGASMASNTAGFQNTAVGQNSLMQSTGNFNVAIGQSAGANATSGSNNIYLGPLVLGTAGESNTMYLGGTQTKTVIAGVRGTTTINANAIPVMIDSAGQLGTVSSSRRFKEDIQDMADLSRRLLQLRPVTFRYKQPFGDGSKPIQFGLIAEEVAEVFPELAVRTADGQIETVHYLNLSVLLVNELQKLHHQVKQQVDARREQENEMQRQRERIDVLEQRLLELLGQSRAR